MSPLTPHQKYLIAQAAEEHHMRIREGLLMQGVALALVFVTAIVIWVVLPEDLSGTVPGQLVVTQEGLP